MQALFLLKQLKAIIFSLSAQYLRISFMLSQIVSIFHMSFGWRTFKFLHQVHFSLTEIDVLDICILKQLKDRWKSCSFPLSLIRPWFAFYSNAKTLQCIFVFNCCNFFYWRNQEHLGIVILFWVELLL